MDYWHKRSSKAVRYEGNVSLRWNGLYADWIEPDEAHQVSEQNKTQQNKNMKKEEYSEAQAKRFQRRLAERYEQVERKHRRVRRRVIYVTAALLACLFLVARCHTLVGTPVESPRTMTTPEE